MPDTAPPSLTPGESAKIASLIASHRDRPGALLPLLHAVQDAFGFISPAAVGLIAPALNLSRAEVHGVITFYAHFRSSPPGRMVVELCQAEACQACGADDLRRHAEQRLGCKLGQTREDGAVTLEPVYCLGLCAVAPSITIDHHAHARVSIERFDALLAQKAAQ